jgi:hypothetical protein
MTTVGGACFHARMGRHLAADGAASHPLVADALTRRPGGAGAHRERAELPGREGPIGWPGPEPDGTEGPIGWPGSLPGSPGSEQSVSDEEPPARESPAGRRRGWRRVLGRTTAA